MRKPAGEIDSRTMIRDLVPDLISDLSHFFGGGFCLQVFFRMAGICVVSKHFWGTTIEKV